MRMIATRLTYDSEPPAETSPLQQGERFMRAFDARAKLYGLLEDEPDEHAAVVMAAVFLGNPIGSMSRQPWHENELSAKRVHVRVRREAHLARKCWDRMSKVMKALRAAWNRNGNVQIAEDDPAGATFNTALGMLSAAWELAQSDVDLDDREARLRTMFDTIEEVLR